MKINYNSFWFVNQSTKKQKQEQEHEPKQENSCCFFLCFCLCLALLYKKFCFAQISIRISKNQITFTAEKLSSHSGIIP
jgi:hypothetical protein